MSRANGSGNGMGLFMLAIIGSVSLVIFSIILLIGLSLVGGVSSDLGSTGAPFDTAASPNPVTGSAVEFADTTGAAEILEVYTVQDSTGNAVNLTGASDSKIESKNAFSISSDDTWTACTWGRVDADAANDEMTALSVNGRVIIQYNGTVGNWSAWYYDEGSTNSYRVNVAAANQPSNFTNVCAWHNTTHFTIYRNTTRGDIVNTSSGSSIEDVNGNSTNWDGRLDETRTFDTALNASQRQALVNYGVVPLTNATRTARITYDEGSGSTTAIYFADTSADVSNFTWDSGLAGTDLTSGVDYTLSVSGGTITALDGGMIDGAPVVWIDYRYKPLNVVGEVAEAIRPAFQLAATISIAIPGVVVLGLLIGSITLIGRAFVGSDWSDIEIFGRRRGGGR